jgi:hypothetical protein
MSSETVTLVSLTPLLIPSASAILEKEQMSSRSTNPYRNGRDADQKPRKQEENSWHLHLQQNDTARLLHKRKFCARHHLWILFDLRSQEVVSGNIAVAKIELHLQPNDVFSLQINLPSCKDRKRKEC